MIPLALFVLSAWVHSTHIPGTPIILDFIGQRRQFCNNPPKSLIGVNLAKPQPISVVLLLDLVIVFLELLVAAIFYEHVITYANVLSVSYPSCFSVELTVSLTQDGKSSRYHRRLAGSHLKSYTTRRVNFVLDMPLALFIKLLFNPKSLLVEPARSHRPTAPDTGGDEDASIWGSSTGIRLAGLPLPFNLGSTAPNRGGMTENPIPGTLTRD